MKKTYNFNSGRVIVTFTSAAGEKLHVEPRNVMGYKVLTVDRERFDKASKKAMNSQTYTTPTPPPRHAHAK